MFDMQVMRKNIGEYGLYVFDLDGTLYDQPRLRLIMALRLMMFYILHPFSVRELFLLSYFRKVKDRYTDFSEEELYQKVAEDKNSDEETVRKTVLKWIYEAPLSVLYRTRDDMLAGWIDDLLVVTAVIRLARFDLERYRRWKSEAGRAA